MTKWSTALDVQASVGHLESAITQLEALQGTQARSSYSYTVLRRAIEQIRLVVDQLEAQHRD